MHGIIMGAGEGTRMWPLSSLVNKHLLKLGGVPVIRIIVKRIFHAREWDSITIVCLKKDFKDYRWEFRDMADSVRFHVIEENTGTATEFYEALCEISTSDSNSFFLHYGDTMTDLDYARLIKFWYNDRKDAKAVIAVTQNIKHDYSQVHVDAITKLVMMMEEKPKLLKPSWTGIGIFNAGYFKTKYREEKNFPVDFGFHILPSMVKDGELYAYQYDGVWYDVGNLRSYQKLYKEYQNKDLNL